MIELFRERDFTIIGFYQSLLESEGIQTFVRNENLSVTEVQIPTFCPALCILNEDDYPRAVEILKAHAFPESAAPAGGDWICPSCGEENPGNFDLCWSCEKSRGEMEGASVS
ncbi:MAG: DUF2007 domain-containing protein [Luteolibacter sp.]